MGNAFAQQLQAGRDGDEPLDTAYTYEDPAATTFGTPTGIPVYVNVYHLMPPSPATPLNGAVLGLGAFHSGVEVLGTEWAFGGDPTNPDRPGVFSHPPRAVLPAAQFHRAHHVGNLPFSASTSAVQEVAARLGAEWTAGSYNVMLRNCNHFAQAFVAALSEQYALQPPLAYPGYINRAALAGSALIPPQLVDLLQRSTPRPPSSSPPTSSGTREGQQRTEGPAGGFFDCPNDDDSDGDSEDGRMDWSSFFTLLSQLQATDSTSRSEGTTHQAGSSTASFQPVVEGLQHVFQQFAQQQQGQQQGQQGRQQPFDFQSMFQRFQGAAATPGSNSGGVPPMAAMVGQMFSNYMSGSSPAASTATGGPTVEEIFQDEPTPASWGAEAVETVYPSRRDPQTSETAANHRAQPRADAPAAAAAASSSTSAPQPRPTSTSSRGTKRYTRVELRSLTARQLQRVAAAEGVPPEAISGAEKDEVVQQILNAMGH